MKKSLKTYKAKKLILLSLVSLLLLGGAVAAYAYANINEQPPTEVVQSEDVTSGAISDSPNPSPSSNQAEILRQGQFIDGDAIHKAQGVAKIVYEDGRHVLVFEDFKVLDGPDVFVYLSPNAAGKELGEFASLGRLKSPSGNQAYSVPANHEDYKTVVIWCRAFGVTFATAELN